MDLQHALSQLDAIHAQVSRTETFRGYRPLSVGMQGGLALAAAAAQATWFGSPAENVALYLQLWIGIASLAASIVVIDLLLDCYSSPSQFARRHTWQAIQQFLPCIAAGGALTWVLAYYSPDSLHLLPGLWSIVFSLGLFSAARQLPPATMLVAAYYLVGGLAAISLAAGDHTFSPWAMAGTFGIGQLATAWVLYADREWESQPSARGKATS